MVSAAIIVPQVMVALFSPWAGRLAQSIGRRPVLLVGFAALPLRGLLFVSLPDAVPLVVIQVLDGVSATVFGLMVPLIAADLTHRNGFLNLAIGSFALAAGLGATFSTTAAGWLADTFGAPAAFFGLALIGRALLLVWLADARDAARQAAHPHASPGGGLMPLAVPPSLGLMAPSQWGDRCPKRRT